MLDWWDWLLWGLWDDWREFHLSIAWGNIATVTVAIAAIIVSARFNVHTMRNADARFRQERRDTEVDKLRNEVAAFVTAVTDRAIVSTIMEPFANADRTEASAADALTQVAKTFPSPDFRDTVQRIGAHGWTILMLTRDETITRIVGDISVKITEELNDLRSVQEIASGPNPGVNVVINAQEQRDGREQREDDIWSEVLELLTYCFQNFRP